MPRISKLREFPLFFLSQRRLISNLLHTMTLHRKVRQIFFWMKIVSIWSLDNLYSSYAQFYISRPTISAFIDVLSPNLIKTAPLICFILDIILAVEMFFFFLKLFLSILLRWESSLFINYLSKHSGSDVSKYLIDSQN